MAIKLFGFEIVRPKVESQRDSIASPITPQIEDGAVNITTAGSYGFYIDLDGSYRSELDLVTKYRTMSTQPEVESAIEDIVNEAIVHDNKGKSVSIITDDLKQPESIKAKIREEFDNVLRLLDFGNFGNDAFRRWYIDGRIYYNLVIDEKNPRAGIKELIYIDPRRIRKVRNIIKKKNVDGVEIVERIDEFYLYNEKVLNNQTQTPQVVGNSVGGVKIAKDSIVLVTSGLFDPTKSTVLSYLHKAIRPMNQLRFVEDAIVIYRVSRAPERRVFYVDVGGMPKAKAEQYLQNMMNKFRTRLNYDSVTGEVRDDRKHYSMLEDFWMPRHGEGKNTEITTLPSGQNLGELEDVKYFENKLYKSLNVPISRLESQGGFTLGRSNEITRDELKFMKFIDKLRDRFSLLFDEILARQLALKGVCTLEEWQEFKQDIHYDFLKDNNFTELKEAELLQNRINTLAMVDPYIGRYYSKRWVQEHVLRLDEDDIEKMEEEMDEELQADMEKQKQMADAGLAPDGSPLPPTDQGAEGGASDGGDQQGGDTGATQEQPASQEKKPAASKKKQPAASNDINTKIQEILK